VLDACDQAREVVELLSDHAQPGARAPEPLDLQRAVPELIRRLRRSRRPGLTLHVTVDPTVGRLVGRPADLQLLVTSLVELADLALAETPGAVEISVRRSPASGAGGGGEEVRLAIAYGPLSPSSAVAMRPRGGESPPPADAAAELLALIRHLTPGVGGRDVVVESGPNGSRVAYVDLPVLSDAAAAAVGHDAPPPPRGTRILFVDDERVLVDLGREMLQLLGHDTEGTTDARQALEWVVQDPGRYACEVPDQTMPGMSGEELVRRLQALAPSVSVVVCTGHSEVLTAERARELGVRAFLPKPFTIAELGQAIQRAIAPRQHTGEK
jgi:CheY-like chemotaxis protein